MTSVDVSRLVEAYSFLMSIGQHPIPGCLKVHQYNFISSCNLFLVKMMLRESTQRITVYDWELIHQYREIMQKWWQIMKRLDNERKTLVVCWCICRLCMFDLLCIFPKRSFRLEGGGLSRFRRQYVVGVTLDCQVWQWYTRIHSLGQSYRHYLGLPASHRSYSSNHKYFIIHCRHPYELANLYGLYGWHGCYNRKSNLMTQKSIEIIIGIGNTVFQINRNRQVFF